MSYERINKIKIKDCQVLITSKCNNDTEPVKEWLCSTLTETLNQQGERALTIEILKAYESGNFQAGVQNKYTDAIRRLQELPEYEKFNWRLKEYKYTEGVRDFCPIESARETNEFDELLLIAYNTAPPKEKFVLTKKNFDDTLLYCKRVTTRMVKWTNDITDAKIFKFESDCERVKTAMYNGNICQTLKL